MLCHPRSASSSLWQRPAKAVGTVGKKKIAVTSPTGRTRETEAFRPLWTRGALATN